jgi:prevent-host-death family protein
MNSTYSITQAQAKFPGLVREAQAAPVLITRHDETVAYVVSKRRMDAIAETLELLANPAALKALRAARKGRARYAALDEIAAD